MHQMQGHQYTQYKQTNKNSNGPKGTDRSSHSDSVRPEYPTVTNR
jgi:hypothetical protein